MAIQKIKSQAISFSPQNVGKNLIINGGMSVSQKTSNTGAGTFGDGFHLADKWESTNNSGGKNTHVIAADAPSGYPFVNSYKIDRQGADDDITPNPGTTTLWTLSQKIKGQDLQHLLKGTSNAKQLTLSFWSKFGGGDASNGVNYTVELVDLDNNRQISKRVETNTDWTRNVITFPADTTGAFDNDNNPSLQINWWLAAGSNYNSGTLNESAWASTTDANRASSSHLTLSRLNEAKSFQLTGVQLEVGEVADPIFEVEPYETTLRKCGGVTFSSDAPPIVNRNLIINGGMDIWQRSTDKAIISGYNTADRWRTVAGAGGFTQRQSTTNIPTNNNLVTDNPSSEGFAYSLEMDCTTADASLAAGDVLYIEQRIEGQNLQHIRKGYSNAKPLTLSFWARGTSGTYIVELWDETNNRSISKSYTVDSTFRKITITFEGDRSDNNNLTIDNDNTIGLRVIFWFAAGSTYTSGTLATSWGTPVSANRAVGQTNLASSTSNYFNLTGVQLEVGDTATGFEFEPYETVLRKCQRYYYQLGGASVYERIGAGVCRSTTQVFITTDHPVPMRAVPTLSISAANHFLVDGSGGTQCSAISITHSSTIKLGLNISLGSAGDAAGSGAQLVTNNNLNARMKLTAEL